MHKISRKTYYALIYKDDESFAGLDRGSGHPFKVDDISLAWLRRDVEEFVDMCRAFPELKVVRVKFSVEPYEE